MDQRILNGSGKVEITEEQLRTFARLSVMGALQKTQVNRQALLDRGNGFQSMYGYNGARDYYTSLGYPKTVRFQDYEDFYYRGDIAGKIVDLPAKDTWKKPPLISDGRQTEKEEKEIREEKQPLNTPFLEDWDTVVNRRKVWHYLSRADRISGIGRFGVMFLGIKNSGKTSDPLNFNAYDLESLMYLSVFSEGSVEIVELEEDNKDKRFGLPKFYRIKMGENTKYDETVHWSRIIHFADDLTENEVYSRPRLERVVNRLHDLMKVVGGGSEATWRLAYQGIHANIKEGYNFTPEQRKFLADEIDEYIHDTKRFVRTQGVDITQLGGQVVDPSGLFNINISLISAASGIPQRILIGSERGELASSQDAENWAGIISSRQTEYGEPLLRKFIDRLIWLGILTKPENGLNAYGLTWPDIYQMSVKEQAEVGSIEASTTAVENQDLNLPIITRWRRAGLTQAEIDRALADKNKEIEFGFGDFITPGLQY